MAVFKELKPEEQRLLSQAYQKMEEERASKGENITTCSYSTLEDFFTPYDMYLAFFYDPESDKLYERTVIYATGLTLFQEVVDAERLVNESESSKAIAWVLLRNGAYGAYANE